MKRIVGIIVVLALALTWVGGALSGDWYAGNSRFSSYGAWAYIFTPLYPLYLEALGNSGESNWVSTYHKDLGGLLYWIQAGWRIYHDFNPYVPKKYVESCIYCFSYYQDYYMNDHSFGNQSWGTSEDYWVVWRDDRTVWCAIIDGVEEHCKYVHIAPITVQAKSEVHISSLNELDTIFQSVRYKDTQVWRYFDQKNFSSDAPYFVDANTNYDYRNYRGNTIYLPLVYNNY